MRWSLVFGLCAACGGSEDTDTTEAPVEFFTLATSGDLSVSFTADADAMNPASASDGGSGCEDTWRGVAIAGPDGVSANFYIDGCAAFSEGGPPISATARLEVRSASGETFSTAYFDGTLNESIDGCIASIAAVTRWVDSPWDENHLFLTGTYSCAELYDGHGEDDPVAIPQPGTFVLDWTGSAP